ncbi:hypothetical protein ABPG74_001293 [Tetrahymena malaccensis]
MAQGKQTSNIYVTEQCSSFVDLDYQYSISQTHRQDSLFAQGLNCPNLEKYDNPQNVFEYVVQNMIVIPKTNILIINTMQQSSTGSSYVYYVDLASAQIINTIKPSYQIINMRYHKKTDQIVVQNKGNIFLTDPYTLKVLNSFSGFNFSQLDLIEGTKYIIVSLFHDQCWVIDISQQISVFHLNNLPDIETFPDGSALTQYITKCYTLSTDFYGNPTNRRFVINHEGETEKVVLLNNNQVQLIDRKNFGSYPFDSTKQKPPLTYAQLDEFAVFYQVKYTTNQFFVKTTDDASDYITTFQMYPLNQLDYSIDIYTKYNHYWGHFSDVLDPFFFNNSVWVGLPEPTKAISKNYIISLINCWTGDIIYLVSDSGDDTAIKSAYGLASLDDQDNQEYIVFDDYGNIYTWDLSKPNFPFKSKIDFALKAISRLQMVLIGDYDTGVGYVFKYDPVNDQFNIFLKFKPTKTNDKLSFIDILDDNTIWFQYQYSTIFYNINDCLNDPTQCLECTQQYYFDTTNQYDENGLYGNGQQENTFTTSYNFFTSMIKNFLFDVANMNVEIITSPENILVLNPNFMNFDFNNIISLSFQSLKPGNYAFISYFNQLNLQDYNLIKFQDVAILFDLSQSDKCGLNLQNIQNGVVFNNIQLKPLVQPPKDYLYILQRPILYFNLARPLAHCVKCYLFQQLIICVRYIQAFKFGSISLSGIPNTSVKLQFTSDQIYILDPKDNKYYQNYHFDITINFRSCGNGEQITQLDQVTQCQVCPENQYSFKVQNCQECPKGATCLGGSSIVANAGYWRKSNDSDLVLYCNNLPDNCKGGSFGDNICYEGHIGALCEECDFLELKPSQKRKLYLTYLEKDIDEYLKNVSGDINESNATLKQINNAQQDYEKQIELKQIQSNEIQAMQNSNSSPFQQDKVEKQRQSKLQKGNNKVTINQINSIYLENCLCKQQEQDFKLQEQDLKQILSSQNEKNQSDNNILLLSGQIEQIYRGNQHERANTDQCFIDSNKFILGLQPQGTLQEINNQNENREAKFDNQTQLFVEETEEIQYTEQNDLNVQNEDNLQSRSPDYPKNNTQRYQFMLESKINLLKDIQQDLFEKKSQDQCLKKELGLQAIILEQDTESLQNIIQDNQNVNKKNQQISIQLIEEKNNIDKGGLDFNSNKLITAQHVASTKIDQNFDTQNLIIFENSQDIIYDQDIEVKVLK